MQRKGSKARSGPKLVRASEGPIRPFDSDAAIGGAHFNLEIGMLEQLKGRTFKMLKNKNLENYKLENQNLEKQKS
jgi:hypothetical protein